MTRELWNDVDEYLAEVVVQPDDDVQAAIAASLAAGLPDISVSAAQGKFLHLLAVAKGARSILEIGTLGGYSTIWLARALQSGGTLVSLEIDPRHAAVARENVAAAGLADVVDIRVGPAVGSLVQLMDEARDPIDLAFIDADKQNNADYFDWAVRLGRSGTVIVVDNVVRGGAVLDPMSEDEAVRGTRRLHADVGRDSRVEATVVQTVGSKGYDGFLLAIVR